jgi:hypothetical protein
MRQYYASDKKRREDAKRKQKEAKRLKKLSKSSKNSGQPEPDAEAAAVNPESDSPTLKSE